MCGKKICYLCRPKNLGMKNTLKEYDIGFSGLKLGEHRFKYELTAEFFEKFDYQSFEEASFQADLHFVKKERSLELNFELAGKAYVPCDITAECFWLPLRNTAQVQVKFGEAFDDTDDALLILPAGEIKLNVAQYLYELAVLALPLKVVHPDVLAGVKGQEELQKLADLSPEKKDESKKKDEGEIDPRWNKLKDLLN